MIDYLEQLFAPETDAREAPEEPMRIFQSFPGQPEESVSIPRSFSPEPEEPVAAFPVGLPEEQRSVPVADPVSQREDRADYWQREALRRLDSALDVPEEERESVAIRRPAPSRAGEELERRLRRDSRRYDSGFFWY